MNLLGPRGESQAARFLQARGVRILARNYRCRYGEIDLVGEEEGTLCFVEVKTRRTDDFADPLASVTPAKQRRIARAATHFLQARGLYGHVACRFDVVALLEGRPPEHYPDAFQLPSP